MPNIRARAGLARVKTPAVSTTKKTIANIVDQRAVFFLAQPQCFIQFLTLGDVADNRLHRRGTLVGEWYGSYLHIHH